MSNKNDYDNLLDKIISIPEDEIQAPNNIPVDVYIQEAENLHNWALNDRYSLISRGLAPRLIDELPKRSGALRHAQSVWITSRFTREEAREQWSEESKAAYDLRDELLAELGFAFRNHQNLSGRVDAIADGTGHEDMLQDLNDLAVLGKNNPDLLKLTNFKTELLDKAAAVSAELSALLARAAGETNEAVESRILRDQAYTYLKTAVDEVSDYGKFVFRKNQSRLNGYRSAYLRKVRRKSARKRKEKEKKKTPNKFTILI